MMRYEQQALSSTDLPRPVLEYLRRAVPDPDRVPERVRITQRGRMRMKPGGRWMRFTATEDFQVRSVGITWRARFPIGPFRLTVLDEYARGAGRLHGTLCGVLPIVRATGDEVASAQAQRYLSELVWVPPALGANRELSWRQLDDRTVEVTASVGSGPVALRLGFDDDGDIVSAFTPARARMVGKEAVDTPWRGAFGDFAVLGGMRIPTWGKVCWELPEGPFAYWEGRITDVEPVNGAAPPAGGSGPRLAKG